MDFAKLVGFYRVQWVYVHVHKREILFACLFMSMLFYSFVEFVDLCYQELVFFFQNVTCVQHVPN
jgi:hypothetical protein